MGTAPFNFPPESVINIGQTLTGNKLGLTGSLSATTFFTAPNPGLYLIAAAMQIVTTNNAGTLATTIHTPHAGTVVAANKLVVDLDPSGPTDGYMAAIPVWMNAGDVVQASTIAAGLTGTTYNLFVSATRLF